MTLPRQNEFMTKCFERLRGSAPLAAIVGDRVYNYVVPEQIPYPYVRYSTPVTNDWSTKTEFGMELELQLDIWDDQRGALRAAKAADLLIDLFHNAPLTLPSGASVLLQYVQTMSLTEPDGQSQHTVLRFRSLITSTP